MITQAQADYLNSLQCKFSISVVPPQYSVEVFATIDNGEITIGKAVLMPSGEQLPPDSVGIYVSNEILRHILRELNDARP